MHTHLELPELRLLSEILLAVHPKCVSEEGLPETMDPLLDKLLSQAHAQIEEAAYCIELDPDELKRIQGVLAEALDEAAEDGDIFLIGQLQGLFEKFSEE
jgi:hypothetical protein